MSKREEYIGKLKHFLADPEKLEQYLIQHSNLPGPRANLELAFGFARIYDDLSVLLRWIDKSHEADVNDLQSFPSFCVTICLGHVFVGTLKKNRLIKNYPAEVERLLSYF